jgi:hypothetical protein
MNAGKKETEGYSRPAFRRCNNGFAGSFTQSRNRQPDRLSRNRSDWEMPRRTSQPARARPWKPAWIAARPKSAVARESQFALRLCPGSNAPARNRQEDAIGRPRAIQAREPSASGFPLQKACQNRSGGLQIAAAPPTKHGRFIEMGIRLSGSWKNCSTKAEAERFMAKVISSDMTCRRYRYSPNCWRNVASPGMDIRAARFK